MEIVGSMILAAIPAIIWGYIYHKKQPEKRRLVVLTFLAGALAVFPILLYKFSWQFFPQFNAFNFADNYETDIIGFSNLTVLPLGILITFMIVGIIEEVMKLLAVKISDDDEIRSIDDSIEFFILAALGFAFIENILYFYNIWITQGGHQILLPFLFRSSFSTFAHIMFSGILGYYYGVAHFAKPILQEEIRQNRHHWTKWLHKVFNWRTTKVFYQEKMLEGILIAASLHAIFNIFLEMNLTFMIVPYLVAGYIALNYLFDKKESHKNYKKLLVGIRNHDSPRTGRKIKFRKHAVHLAKS